MTSVLVTGGTGLLAPYLAKVAGRLGDVVVTARSGGDLPCDLTDESSVRKMLDSVKPGYVLHCAALTNVDACERDAELADALNHRAVAIIAKALAPNACLVQVSTDQVYPNKPGPHVEGSEAPVNVYGRSKLEGEGAALRHPKALVLRVNFFGSSRTEGRSSLSDWIVESLRNERNITLFSDSLFSPLHVTTLSELIVEATSRSLRGIFNLGCRDGGPKAEFGLAVARHLGLQTGTAKVGKSIELSGRAPRPYDLRMAVDKIEVALGCSMPRLNEEIAKL